MQFYLEHCCKTFTHVQTCLATNQIVAGCKKLFQNVDIVLLFATKSVRVGVLPAQGKLVLRHVTSLSCMA